MAGRRRTGALPLVSIVVFAAAFLALTFIKGWSPALGLDLQGGASVVYQAGNDVPDEALDDAISIIRSRVDALGVAEPEIVRQGDSIVVNLPGVKDRDRALDVIGRTAELRFRPVLNIQPYITQEQYEQAQADAATSTTDTTVPGETTTTLPGDAPSSTTATTAGDTTSTSEGAIGVAPPAGLAEGEYAGVLLPSAPGQDGTTATTSTPDGTDTTATTGAVTDGTDPSIPGASTTLPGSDETIPPLPGEDTGFDPCLALGATTPEDADTADATVILPSATDADDNGSPDFCFQLGPVPTQGDRELLGSVVSGPEAQINQGSWGVSLNIRGDDLPLFNQTASQCFNKDQTACPTGQLAIVLDGAVQSAPTIEQPQFDSNGLSITGSFSEREARDLALILRFGALPVQLEAQTVQTVSATLGEDSLNAGLVAGFIGVGLVILYLLLYYRALGVIVVFGLCVWSALNFAIISWLGETQGLALSLSGVTGIVVSVGVTVDSYVVYFERLKDEIRSGKTIRSSVDRGFQRAFRTIVAADVSSFIGAALLYTLTVGPVRGFAFFLGLSTLLDMLVAYFFTRPVVGMVGRSNFFTQNRVFGVARGLGVRKQETAVAN